MLPAFAPPPPAIQEAVNPVWKVRPSGDDFARFYPDRAFHNLINGKATIGCTITPTGELTACEIVQESPVGEGFGEAAMRMAPLFRTGVDTPAEKANIGKHTTIRIRFVLPNSVDVAAPTAAGAAACYGLAAKAATHSPADGKAWSSTLYWYVLLGGVLANGGGSPEDLETMTRTDRQAAEAGTLKPPEGYTLEYCLSKGPQ